jgi:peptidoglycan biosynthesis protein MviN/MurJ (putative lipid II flippase)
VIGAAIGAAAGGLSGLSWGLLAAMLLETIIMLPTVYQLMVRPQFASDPT